MLASLHVTDYKSFKPTGALLSAVQWAESQDFGRIHYDIIL